MKIEKEDIKKIWLLWFLANKQYWCNGLTYTKIIKMESNIINDKEIWYDLLERHPMNNKLPWNAENEDKATYNHAIGNMAGIIAYKAQLLGYIRK